MRGKMDFRLIVAGGGTGGHFFPGLALAQTVMDRAPEAEVIFVGSRRGIEAKLASHYGFDFHGLPAYGFSNVSPAKKLKAFAGLLVSFLTCLLLEARIRPSAIVGVGGYASFPMALAASLAGVPLILMEQNVEPGLSNRLLAPLAGAVVTAFPQTARFFGRKTLPLGNPVRESLSRVAEEKAPERPLRLLVFGGSGGAKALNDAMIDAIPALSSFPGGIEILHQTGPTDLDRVKEAYGRTNLKAGVEPFIYEMEKAYGWCHAVFCRAGATTLAELASVKRPALLVPFPHSAGGHQLKNALGFAALGCALCIEEKDLNRERLLESLKKLSDPETRRAMRKSLGTVARPDAARRLADLLLAGGER